jgi:hypothetical protein
MMVVRALRGILFVRGAIPQVVAQPDALDHEDAVFDFDVTFRLGG